MVISYQKLWTLLDSRNMKKKDLREVTGISSASMAKLAKNQNVTTDVLAKICEALHCDIGDIMEMEGASIENNHTSCDTFPTKHLKVISLFSGAGGLDIGFEKAGFEIAIALEADPACCDTLRTNRPNLPIINKKIQNVSVDDVLSKSGLKPLEAALVIGGPPCQSFSLAGLRKGLNDERGQLLFEYVRIVRGTLPFGFVLENVKGLANWDSGRALKMLLDELSKPITYKGNIYKYTIAKPQILNAVDFDVPQYRERIVIVGNRAGLPFEYPKPHLSRKTVWNAIGNLPEPEAPSKTAIRVAKTIKGRREKFGY